MKDQVFADLFEWCREHDFAGYDPFDGLNSRLFQASPFKSSRTARLLWTQLCKRSPINLRGLVGVPPQRNAKGVALFALAAADRVQVRHLRPSVPTLEDVFAHAVGED
jgi:hypothetical protein